MGTYFKHKIHRKFGAKCIKIGPTCNFQKIKNGIDCIPFFDNKKTPEMP